MKNNLRKRLEYQIIEKAMKEEIFRKQLIENPKATIEEITNFKFPKEVAFSVLEEDSKTFYLVLPQAPGKEEDLSEFDLNAISGGAGYTYAEPTEVKISYNGNC